MPLLGEGPCELSPCRCRLDGDKVRIEHPACSVMFLHRMQDFSEPLIGKVRQRDGR